MRHITKIGAILAVVAATVLISSGAAQASYTAIDQAPTLENGQPTYDENGFQIFHSVQISFSGYCDSQNNIGEGCDAPYSLPYNVIFGANQTNQVLVRDDGSLDFVYGPPSDLEEFSTDAERTHRFQVLASFDSGINGGSYPQLASFALQGSSFLASWFVCPSPGPSCRTGLHTAMFTPGSGGFQIAYTDLSGGRHSSFLAADFDPSQSSATPEPDAWALMIIGLGATGHIVRSARKRARQRAV